MLFSRLRYLNIGVFLHYLVQFTANLHHLKHKMIASLATFGLKLVNYGRISWYSIFDKKRVIILGVTFSLFDPICC